MCRSSELHLIRR